MAKIYESTVRAKKKWERENYDTLNLRVKKGERERIKTFAAGQGKSLNAFCKEAIYSAMGEKLDPESAD